MFTDYTIDEAKRILSEHITTAPKVEQIKFQEAMGRITAEDVISGCDVPGFDRSMMDGYAVRSEDISGASEDNPIKLELIGMIEMGKSTDYTIEKGKCVYIPTGGMLPQGADSVIMIEKTSVHNNEVSIHDKTFINENIIMGDEDAKTGEIIIKKGTQIRPYEIGVMASIGYGNPLVLKKLKIGILSTGDELVEPEDKPMPGQVRDINTSLMNGLILEAGGIPIIYSIKTDIYEKIFEATRNAVKECDIVLISGGSSVGIKDYTIKVIEALDDTKILFHGLALKPGKPTISAISGNKLIFGMPGHPLSCAVVFKTLVKYSMELLQGYKEVEYPIYCRLKNDFKKTKNREEYIPVIIDIESDEYFATPIRGKSGIISTFSKAYGYIKTIKEQDILKIGDIVKVYRL